MIRILACKNFSFCFFFIKSDSLTSFSTFKIVDVVKSVKIFCCFPAKESNIDSCSSVIVQVGCSDVRKTDTADFSFCFTMYLSTKHIQSSGACQLVLLHWIS